MSLQGQKIFVTGGTGFIGGRLIEKLLLEEGAEVIALVRRFKNASRLARFSIKMVAGDIMDLEGMSRAMAGCTSVVHCAVDGSGTPEQNRRIAVDGTRHVCLAAEKANIKRLVHLSTISVYGRTPPGPMDESTPKNPKPDPYGTNKLEAEDVVLGLAKAGLPATVLQPTVVYGPWAYWTTAVATQLDSGTVVLPNGGEGICNAVYIDDVVEVICSVLRGNQSGTGPYLISGKSPVTWADYYRAYAKWIPGSAIATEPVATITRRLARQQFVGSIAPMFFPKPMRLKISRKLQSFPGIWQVYNAARGQLPSNSPDIPPGAFPVVKPNPSCRVFPPMGNVRYMALRSSVSIKKAQDELNYNPRFDLNEAMKIVGPWLQWAGFAPR